MQTLQIQGTKIFATKREFGNLRVIELSCHNIHPVKVVDDLDRGEATIIMNGLQPFGMNADTAKRLAEVLTYASQVASNFENWWREDGRGGN